MNPRSVDIAHVKETEVEALRSFGEATFRETFEDQNDPENLESYLKHSFTLDKMLAQLNTPNTDFYFARIDNKIVGYLKLNLTENEVEIERIYVKQGFQGLKIGKALFAKAMDTAQKRSAKSIWLGVWQENKKAIAFYEHLGFQTFDVRQFKLGNDLQDDILMRLTIQA